MSANLLDPRLHRRAGADHLAELLTDGVVICSGAVAGRGVVSPNDNDFEVHNRSANAVPVDPDQIYTVWAVVVGTGNVYFSISTKDSDGMEHGEYPVGLAHPGGALLYGYFRPRNVSDNDDNTTVTGVGFDISADNAFEIRDIGLVRGRAAPWLIRHRRRQRLDFEFAT